MPSTGLKGMFAGRILRGYSHVTPPTTWSETLIQLVALAGRLEREGQYNVAKLARAAADALARQAAFAIDLPPDNPSWPRRQTMPLQRCSPSVWAPIWRLRCAAVRQVCARTVSRCMTRRPMPLSAAPAGSWP